MSAPSTTINGAPSSTIAIKWDHGGQMRRFTLPAEGTDIYEALMQKCTELRPHFQANLFYVDGEGDPIRFSTTDELRDAFTRHEQGAVFKIFSEKENDGADEAKDDDNEDEVIVVIDYDEDGKMDEEEEELEGVCRPRRLHKGRRRLRHGHLCSKDIRRQSSEESAAWKRMWEKKKKMLLTKRRGCSPRWMMRAGCGKRRLNGGGSGTKRWMMASNVGGIGGCPLWGKSANSRCFRPTMQCRPMLGYPCPSGGIHSNWGKNSVHPHEGMMERGGRKHFCWPIPHHHQQRFPHRHRCCHH